jgi:predicted MFS family arabinose efflux permease
VVRGPSVSSEAVASRPVLIQPGHASAVFVIVCICMTSLTYGFGRYAYGLFLPAIRAEYQLDSLQLGLLGSVSTTLYLITNLGASCVASYLRPYGMIVAGGLLTTVSLAVIGAAHDRLVTEIGIATAGVGAGIYSPALFEAIQAWLSGGWKNRAIAALNAGATPGLVLTGIAAYVVKSEWRLAWVLMACAGALFTLATALCVPRAALRSNAMQPPEKMRLRDFVRPQCLALYTTLFVYGLLFGVYKTFAIDVLSRTGGIQYPYDRLFWALLGLAGVPAIFVGTFIGSLGVRAILGVSMTLCGSAYVALALAPSDMTLVLTSATIFGLASIVPGSGFLVWGIHLFHKRPSVGSGVVFLAFSLSLVIGPILFGMAETWMRDTTLFWILAALSVVSWPLFPINIYGTEPGDEHQRVRAQTGAN